jgi:hypothetical protein
MVARDDNLYLRVKFESYKKLLTSFRYRVSSSNRIESNNKYKII